MESSRDIVFFQRAAGRCEAVEACSELVPEFLWRRFGCGVAELIGGAGRMSSRRRQTPLAVFECGERSPN